MDKKPPTIPSSPPSGQDERLIVGIGASAGGVEALRVFFENVPDNSGLAYIVILHLSPDYDSQLAQILQGVAGIPVIQVTETVPVLPNHVYVVPPNRHLEMQEGQLTVLPSTRPEERRAPVDIFFRTLADSHGPRAVAVILTGTGANGSMGLKRIKENGGAAFVQNPREASFPEMPRHAIATNLVDEILPVAELPARLIAYRLSLGRVEIPVENETRTEDQQQALREIFTQLRLRTGHDFSNYKRPTLMRRLERRINVRNLSHLPAYAAYLREHPEEIQALLKDLLISVTNFFRDGNAFLSLEQKVLPGLLAGKKADDTLRVWVAGCATGEEAYSLAMLLAEYTLDSTDAPRVQIFATDIDEAAVATAREGRYTLNDAADVSPERLNRFFTREGDDYYIRREIREMILFAHHNVLTDPPFSKLDLVSCRNLLIYLNHTAQERVMETFHFALKPGGYLMLGLSETPDGAGDLFAAVSREHHLYQGRPVASRSYPLQGTPPPTAPEKQRSPALPQEERLPSRESRKHFGELHQQLLEQYAPPSIIVNEEYDILHLSERAGRYLAVAGGEPSKNLLKLIRPELRLELRTALYQATQRQTNVEARNLQLRVGEKTETLTIHVRPVMQESDPARGFVLVLFETTDQESSRPGSILTSEEPLARQLEEELIRLKAQLFHSNEHHEAQAEELKASNEELQAMNEELRSAAEELETSKEELQSINEELTTVNQELKVKVEEISLTSNNFQNLINSADLATLFLDRGFRINLFTPAVRTIFNLIPADTGRPLSDITSRLEYTSLLEDAQAVAQSLLPVEREVRTTDGRVFLMRLLPYRTADDRINGIIITFVDITRRKAAEEAVRLSEERMRLVFESAKDYAILTLDLQRHITGWSPGAQAMIGYTEEEILGQSGDILFTAEDREQSEPEREVENIRRQGRTRNERWHLRKDGRRFWASGSVSPLHDAAGQMVGFVKILRDLTDSRAAQEARYFLASIVESSQDSVVTVNFESIITSWNQAAEALYGYTAAEAVGQPLTMLTLPADLAEVLGDIDKIKHSRKVERFDTVRVNKGGRQIVLEIVLSPVRNAEGQVIGVSTIARDITERKRAEQAEALKNLILQQQTETLARTGSWEYDRTDGRFSWSEGMYQLFGLEADAVITPEIYEAFALESDREVARRIQARLREGPGPLEETLRIRVNGGVRVLRIKGVVLPDDTGAPGRVLGIDWDITEQVRAQDRIRDTAVNIQAVLDASPASIGLLKTVHAEDDPDRIIDFTLAVGNQKLAEFFDLPLNRLLGQSAERLSTMLWDEKTLDDLREVYHSRQARYEEKRLNSGGQERWLAVAVTRQDDGLVLTGLDITDLKQAQTQQQYWLAELEQASRSAHTLAELRNSLQERGEVLRSASHDLRGHVGVIASATQLLGLAGSEAERSQMLQMIRRNIQMMTQLMTNLLDLARLEAGQEILHLSRFNPALLLEDLAAGAQAMAQERGLSLQAAGPSDLEIESDPLQVRRIAQNLLLNALKYTQTGGVTLAWQRLDTGWQFSVTDTGPGLSESLVRQLRGQLPADSATGSLPGRSGGEGIGLSIVRRLCVLLGATLTVESEAEKGTRFEVRFEETIPS
ncbi:PAS domain S-box protein [Larkinella soli]|uniref:PAS domain S-box protein n=1 Tax=Larkinella soli TaxID=1770527 RepID=UPI000FFB0EEE|nr:PAS domain S-box protein [Larkinella soli]